MLHEDADGVLSLLQEDGLERAGGRVERVPAVAEVAVVYRVEGAYLVWRNTKF